MRLLLGLLIVFVVGCSPDNYEPSYDVDTTLPAAVEEISPVQLTPLPNDGFRDQLPDDVKDNYRVANVIPGEKIWILEKIPVNYWVLIYSEDGEWLVQEFLYNDTLEQTKDNVAVK